MSTAPEFEQIGKTSLYETPPSNNQGWAGYLLPGAAPKNSIPVSDSLNQYDGSYIFAWTRPPILDSDPDAFIRTANAYIQDNCSGNRVVLWLQSPLGAVVYGSFQAFGFQFAANTFGNLVLQSNLNAAIGSNLNWYVLSLLDIGCTDAGELIVSTKSKSPSMGLQKGLSDLGLEIWDGEYQSVRIPTSGNNTGCFVFTGGFAPSRLFGPKAIDCGLKYSFPANRVDQTAYYPSLALNGLPASVACVGTIDPSDPVNSQTSAADLRKGYLRSGLIVAGTPPLTSTFLTASGKSISLMPAGTAEDAVNPPLSGGGFSLASSSPVSLPVGQGLAYFAPTGKFALSIPADPAKAAEELLCGLFGSERITFANYDATPEAANDLLFFVPSCKGYAPIFPFAEASLDDPNSGAVKDVLDRDVLTPWATLLAANNEVRYKAEPEGSGLYAPSSSSAASDDDAPAILLTSPPSMPLPQGVMHTFPMVSYAGSPSGADSNSLTQFESQILAKERKSNITQGASAVWAARRQAQLISSATLNLTDCATPQGFIAQIDKASGAYLHVAMAQSQPPGGGAQQSFAFDKPTQELQNALETNQLFLVAVNAKKLGSSNNVSGIGPSFANTLYMADWKMQAKVGSNVTPTSYKNVMIFKFCSGTLLERLQNPNRWTSPADFSLVAGSQGASMDAISYTGLSQWAQQYIADALKNADGPSAAFYQDFKKIVTDENWRGILVLQADLPIDSLPAEIAGLAAGIDFTRFTAHHFGVTVSRVTVDKNGAISMDGNSSLFGLIDYTQPTFAMNLSANVSPEVPIPVQASDDFNFLVLQLQCLFRNAKLARFNSYVQLTVRKLFGSQVTQTFLSGVPMPANGVVLKGSYVDQNGSPAYVFQQATPSVFTLDSNVLRAVAFNRVQFNTLGPRDNGQSMASRFLVWGAFDFAQTSAQSGPFDVFSFGSPPNTPPASLGAGLSFSNLILTLTFPVATPNAQRFLLSTESLAYDLASSAQRAGSLFAGFGLQLKSFLNIDSQQTPSDLGFLTVQSAIKASPLTSQWCGVVYQVTMGGPGALASAGNFNSNLVLAWSPSSTAKDTTPSVFLGLSLPGAAPGAKLFSLQGVLKVSVDSIWLQLQDVPDQTGKQFYCLRLDNIGLKVFGIVKLPPDANIQFFLFGDPSNTGSLGWYAAWVASDDKTRLARLDSARPSPLTLPQEVH